MSGSKTTGERPVVVYKCLRFNVYDRAGEHQASVRKPWDGLKMLAPGWTLRDGHAATSTIAEAIDDGSGVAEEHTVGTLRRWLSATRDLVEARYRGAYAGRCEQMPGDLLLAVLEPFDDDRALGGE